MFLFYNVEGEMGGGTVYCKGEEREYWRWWVRGTVGDIWGKGKIRKYLYPQNQPYSIYNSCFVLEYKLSAIVNPTTRPLHTLLAGDRCVSV